ncbi:cobalamin-dependent protein [Halocynthiibacter sp.]|uniref:cobalamin-dependent protein n=1 Tax=Halocynthiibacter sp. TaxID=1979210 RepID=UPI003C624DC8
MNFSPDTLSRQQILPEQNLPKGADLLAEGRQAASEWHVQPAAFQREFQVSSEWEYKHRMMGEGRVMQHAHLGYRSLETTLEALRDIYRSCAEKDVRIDRFGMCLDWSMGHKTADRAGGMRGTGVILDGPDDFRRITEAAPAAMHFGDFMLGFPGAFENAKYALAAGATTLGNLGQYFTFRLPGDNDDVTATAETLRALGLISAQDVPVLVHSNLDDGFAASFHDLCSALGMAIVEKHIVTKLCSARYTVCYGHHFTDPVTRIAFQQALTQILGESPGSQVYGATVLYKGENAQNYASLASYLLPDILAQRQLPSGHAVNPVPVTENTRIPAPDEVIDAQLNLARMSELAAGFEPLLDLSKVAGIRDKILSGAEAFSTRLFQGFKDADLDPLDPFEMLLTLRRMGARAIENRFGSSEPIVPAATFLELKERRDRICRGATGEKLRRLSTRKIRILTACGDVHEHAKTLLDMVFERCGFEIIDGGVSANLEDLASLAENADVIALSTWNGVALRSAEELLERMQKAGLERPLFIGGRLNEIPAESNTGLPQDVTGQLRDIGAYPCADIDEFANALEHLFSA